ncbi:MAG: hypothetical protein H6577_14950 [Lewinellaceae bacterium]|nr:hypothetical protein [Saprospiraceae bacterium]MCB9339425.1 hypothetical protein [Lewinellaceae bacterium]
MKNFTPLIKYFLLFLVLYSVLFGVFSIPSVAKFTADVYRPPTLLILQTLFPKAYLQLEPDAPPESDPYTIRAVFISKTKIEEFKSQARQQGAGEVTLGAKEYDIYFHLLFTSFWLFLVVLILITPLGWKDKLVGVLMGSLLFYCYTVLKISIFLLDVFNRSQYDMYKLGVTGSEVAGWLSYVLKSLGLSAFVVIFMWVLVAFRKSNWRGVIGGLGT